MRNYRFGNASRVNISTVCPDLQNICHGAIRIANRRKLHCPDFGISRGLTTAEAQFELFKKGRTYIPQTAVWSTIDKTKIVTNCDGFEIESPHQSGKAVDFFAIEDGRANYDAGNLALVATCFYEAANDQGLEIEWGGNYRSFSDAPHIELITK